jgi:hypothetical protein
MWYATVLDIESTLRVVCKKVFKDASVSKEVRTRRVEAVLIIGQIFQAEESKEGAFALSDFKKKFGQAGGPAGFAGEEEADFAAGAAEEEQPLSREELHALPAAQLKSMLEEQGIDFSQCVEKSDYVQKALDAQQQRTGGESA